MNIGIYNLGGLAICGFALVLLLVAMIKSKAKKGKIDGR
jgi:hypothetical protein